MRTYSQPLSKRNTFSAAQNDFSDHTSALGCLLISHLQTIKCFMVTFFIITVICIGSSIIVNASDTVNTSSQTRYYTSIRIQEDDTLWDIEARYNSGTEERNDYIHSIMELNHMTSDVLYNGQNLIIYYYSAEDQIIQ